MNIWKGNSKKIRKGQGSGSRRTVVGEREDGGETSEVGLPDVLLGTATVGRLPAHGWQQGREPTQHGGFRGEEERLEVGGHCSGQAFSGAAAAAAPIEPSSSGQQRSDVAGYSKRPHAGDPSSSRMMQGLRNVPGEWSTPGNHHQEKSSISVDKNSIQNSMAAKQNPRSGPSEVPYGETVARYKSSGSRQSSSGARYRSVSSEPRARERLQERKTRCSSATRVKGTNPPFSDEGMSSEQRLEQSDMTYASYHTEPQTVDHYRHSNDTYQQHEYQHLYQQNLYSQQLLSSSESYQQQPVDQFAGQHFQPSSYPQFQESESYGTNPSDTAAETFPTQHPEHHQPNLQSNNLPCSDFYKASDSSYRSQQQHSVTEPQTSENVPPPVPRARGGEYGYQVSDLDGLLTQSSAAHPANLPMVLAAPTRLHHMRRSLASSSRPFLPLGVIVNAVFKTRDWLYVRTAHGAEGFVPYHVCLPLGILPTTSRGANASAATAAWEISPSNDDNQNQERGRCRERRRQQCSANQTDLQKLQPVSRGNN